MEAFKADMREVQKLEMKLKLFASRAVPYAAKGATNAAAFNAMREARANIKNNMILRNRFTLQTIRVEPVRDVRNPRAIVGSTAPYMELQEFGGKKPKKGKEGVLIPMPAASKETALPRKRLPVGNNRINKITLSKMMRRKPKNWKQAMVFKVQNAVLSGNRNVYLEFINKKGIYRVLKGSKKFKRGWPQGATLTKLYDLSRQTVRIPASPWLRPAVDATVRRAPALYLKALQHQARRAGLIK